MVGKYLLEMFGVSLLLTILLELPVLWLLKMRGRKNMLLGFLVNILTNPAAVLLHWLGIPQLPIELVVVLAEAGIFLWFSKDEKWNIPHPVITAVAANGVSWLCGILLGGII